MDNSGGHERRAGSRLDAPVLFAAAAGTWPGRAAAGAESARAVAGRTVSFERVEQLHFTLAFLGEQPADRVDAACAPSRSRQEVRRNLTMAASRGHAAGKGRGVPAKRWARVRQRHTRAQRIRGRCPVDWRDGHISFRRRMLELRRPVRAGPRGAGSLPQLSHPPCATPTARASRHESGSRAAGHESGSCAARHDSGTRASRHEPRARAAIAERGAGLGPAVRGLEAAGRRQPAAPRLPQRPGPPAPRHRRRRRIARRGPRRLVDRRRRTLAVGRVGQHPATLRIGGMAGHPAPLHGRLVRPAPPRF